MGSEVSDEDIPRAIGVVANQIAGPTGKHDETPVAGDRIRIGGEWVGDPSADGLVEAHQATGQRLPDARPR